MGILYTRARITQRVGPGDERKKKKENALCAAFKQLELYFIYINREERDLDERERKR